METPVAGPVFPYLCGPTMWKKDYGVDATGLASWLSLRLATQKLEVFKEDKASSKF